jgi:hypothetical protein
MRRESLFRVRLTLVERWVICFRVLGYPPSSACLFAVEHLGYLLRGLLGITLCQVDQVH